MKRTDDEIVLKVGRDLDEKHSAELSAFNAIYADYLEARAAILRGGHSDEELDKLSDRESRLIWKIIGAVAATKDQLTCKFEILRDMLRPHDDGPQEMLESIRKDALANWENWEWTPLPFDGDNGKLAS